MGLSSGRSTQVLNMAIETVSFTRKKIIYVNSIDVNVYQKLSFQWADGLINLGITGV